MSTEKTLAIVIRSIEFSETSSIVTLFTRDFGKVGGLAKGSRRPKGPFESALDLLAVCRIVLIRKSSEALDLLTEAKLERRFRGTDRGLSHLYAGYYVAELLNELTDLGDPHPELFDLADRMLDELSGPSSAGRLVLRFELAALRLLGHAPALDQCVGCGRPMESAGKPAFALIDGGVVCPTCREGRRQVVSISGQTLRSLTAFTDEDEGWREQPLATGNWGELRSIVNRYLWHLLGRKPRMHEFLAGLMKPDG
jgi:DNA repair protein RecO (recombination protein O)